MENLVGFFVSKSKSNKSIDFDKYKTLFNADDFDLKSGV